MGYYQTRTWTYFMKLFIFAFYPPFLISITNSKFKIAINTCLKLFKKLLSINSYQLSVVVFQILPATPCPVSRLYALKMLVYPFHRLTLKLALKFDQLILIYPIQKPFYSKSSLSKIFIPLKWPPSKIHPPKFPS